MGRTCLLSNRTPLCGARTDPFLKERITYPSSYLTSSKSDLISSELRAVIGHSHGEIGRFTTHDHRCNFREGRGGGPDPPPLFGVGDGPPLNDFIKVSANYEL